MIVEVGLPKRAAPIARGERNGEIETGSRLHKVKGTVLRALV